MTCVRCVMIAVCCLGLILTAPNFSFGQGGQQPAAELTNQQIMKAGKFEGPSQCMNCHTLPNENRIQDGALDFVLLTEYATWKTQDKHAQAYAVLKGSRGKSMETILGQNVTAPTTGCLSCHAMNYLNQEGQDFNISEGVSCGGCHGPSEKWNGPHQNSSWRKNSPEQKAKLGMVDVRSPKKRAELCLSCHVGNAQEGKVITHAMYAAGHPPLPAIEIATFARNLPQHWRDASNVPYFHNVTDKKIKSDYHLETIEFQRTRFALVGAIVALRDTMQLIVDRTNPKPDLAIAMLWPELGLTGGAMKPGPQSAEAALDRWPEMAMAHSDCYGCHHELRSKSWRQTRGYGYPLPNGNTIPGIPGRPQIKPWPISLIEMAVAQAALNPQSKSVADRTSKLEELLRALISSTNAQPFGDPKSMRVAASNIVDWSNGLLADLMNSPYDRANVRKLMGTLLNLKSLRFADYESARQCASIIQVVYDDLQLPKDTEADKEIRKLLGDIWTKLDVRPYADRARRQAIMTDLLMGMTTKKETLGEMQKFYAAIQSENLGNLTLQKSLQDNSFLDTLSRNIGDKKLTAALQEPKIIDALQKSSDLELKKSLDVINDYNPDWFNEQLQKLKELLK